jgi:hypothetical protein
VLQAREEEVCSPATSLSSRNPKINKTHTHDQLANEKTEGTSPTCSWIIYMDEINISRAHNIHLTSNKER